MAKLNAAWHAGNRMPARATREQRIAWHRRHAKACGCRPIPAPLREGLRPLWTCPLCGHRHVTRNMWHSCRRDRVADAIKSGIVFQARVRFAGAVTRKQWLDCGV